VDAPLPHTHLGLVPNRHSMGYAFCLDACSRYLLLKWLVTVNENTDGRCVTGHCDCGNRCNDSEKILIAVPVKIASICSRGWRTESLVTSDWENA
jgi:hypothetical protein